MLTALYYPHTKITDIGLVKNALLLWDQIEYIVPNRYWKMPHQSSNPDLSRALSLIGKPYVPSKQEKRLTHEAISELANSPLPEWFFVDRVRDSLKYPLYEDKFLPETWHTLLCSKLVRASHKERDYIATMPLGLTMMSILADTCAGSQKQPVTDRVDAYSAFNRYLTQIAGGQYKKVQPEYDRLISVSLKVINAKSLDLDKLIALREREQNGEYHLRKLRHSYLHSIEGYSQRLTKARHIGELKEIERQIEQEMKDDIDALIDELDVERKKFIFSKEMVATALLTAGTLVGLAAGSDVVKVGAGPVDIFAISQLYTKQVEYKAKRNKTLGDHAMSWLHLSRNRRLF